LLAVRDPLVALDFDLALAARAQADFNERLVQAVERQDGGGGFFVQVLMLLSELLA
jgi:hypothetical protein